MYNEYVSPNVTPTTHEDILSSMGHMGLHRLVKVSMPTPDEVKIMLQLAEQLPNKE